MREQTSREAGPQIPYGVTFKEKGKAEGPGSRPGLMHAPALRIISPAEEWAPGMGEGAAKSATLFPGLLIKESLSLHRNQRWAGRQLRNWSQELPFSLGFHPFCAESPESLSTLKLFARYFWNLPFRNLFKEYWIRKWKRSSNRTFVENEHTARVSLRHMGPRANIFFGLPISI